MRASVTLSTPHMKHDTATCTYMHTLPRQEHWISTLESPRTLGHRTKRPTHTSTTLSYTHKPVGSCFLTLSYPISLSQTTLPISAALTPALAPSHIKLPCSAQPHAHTACAVGVERAAAPAVSAVTITPSTKTPTRPLALNAGLGSGKRSLPEAPANSCTDSTPFAEAARSFTYT